MQRCRCMMMLCCNDIVIIIGTTCSWRSCYASRIAAVVLIDIGDDGLILLISIHWVYYVRIAGHVICCSDSSHPSWHRPLLYWCWWHISRVPTHSFATGQYISTFIVNNRNGMERLMLEVGRIEARCYLKWWNARAFWWSLYLVVISSSLCSFSEEELGGTFIGKREVDVVFRSFQIQIMKWALRLGIALLYVVCSFVVVCVCWMVCFFSCCKSRSSFGNVQNLYVWRNQYKGSFLLSCNKFEMSFKSKLLSCRKLSTVLIVRYLKLVLLATANTTFYLHTISCR